MRFRSPASVPVQRVLRSPQRLGRLIALPVLAAVLSCMPPAAPKSPVTLIASSAPAPALLPVAAPTLPVEALPETVNEPAPVETVAYTSASPSLHDAQGLSPDALSMALDALSAARARGVRSKSDLLTIIDYSLPSVRPRLWVLDLVRGKVLFHELVAHGSGSGDNYAVRFSNTENSLQTSLGLFLTGTTYEGKNGYSLKLKGLDTGLNDLAEERNIVMHGAWYVSPDQIQRYGRLGRSWGCPALPVASAHPVIDTIKGGSFVFAYAAGQPVLRASYPHAGPSLKSPVAALASTVAATVR